jgi:hypothetical protein
MVADEVGGWWWRLPLADFPLCYRVQMNSETRVSDFQKKSEKTRRMSQ